MGLGKMPWCPNCKKEYDDKVKKCIDCDVVLYHPFYQSREEALVTKLQSFFDFSDLHSVIDYNDKNGLYILSVTETNLEEAKKLYQAFHYVEKDSENLDNEDFDSNQKLEETDDDENHSTAYITKEERYSDYTSSYYTFFFFGVAGLIFVFLNIIGKINLLNGLIPNLVMGGIFIFFIYLGLNTMQKAKILRPEVEEEKELTDKINSWLSDNIDETYVEKFKEVNEGYDEDNEDSFEFHYFKLTDAIKKDIENEFGEQNSDYLDKLIEDYYTDKDFF